MNKIHASSGRWDRAGFSAIELLIVVAVLIVLALILFPSHPHEKSESRETRCLDHLRQLSAGWVYALDNQGKLMPNPGWVTGRMGWRAGEGRPVYFDQRRLIDPKMTIMAEYVKSAEVYRCPADTFKLPEYPRYRVRSISMNGILVGASPSGATVQGSSPGGRKYYGKDQSGDNRPARKMSDLEKPGPSQVFVILDEHPDSIEDSSFMFDPGYAPGLERWRDLPSSSHDGGAGISFADGHAEIHKWVETNGVNKTVYSVRMEGGSPWSEQPVGTSQDYEWLQDRMPYW